MQLIRILLNHDRNRCGIILMETSGVPFGPKYVAARSSDFLAKTKGNAARNSLLRYGDTPTGGFKVTQIVDPHRLDRRRFGQGGIIVMEATSGDATLAEANGRSRILIHGGSLGPGRALRSTAGALRLRDGDLRALLDSIDRKSGVACRCEETASIGETPPVFVDNKCDDQDPPILDILLSNTWPPFHANRRTFLTGGAAFFGTFRGTAVSFLVGVAGQSAAFAQTAYNDPVLDDQHAEHDLAESVVQGKDQDLTSRLTEISKDVIKEAPKEYSELLGKAAADEIADGLNAAASTDAAAAAGDMDYLAERITGAGVEAAISNKAITAAVVEGASEAVDGAIGAYAAGTKGFDVGVSINKLVDGTMSVAEFAQKVGPVPMELLLTSEGVPFADQMVQTTVATGQSGLAHLIDFGFDLWDKAHGYNIVHTP